MAGDGLGQFISNVKTLPGEAKGSFLRHGAPVTDRARSQAVFTNIFLHIHSTRVHPNSLRLTFTWGLGVALASLFAILTATGILLMVYYNPSTTLAYDSIKDLHYVVPTGRFIRNIHRWAAHLMVLFALLHMARVFYTASYKAPRQFNWVIGMVLFVLTLAFSFTGYLLPWDQLAYWAVTIGANIAASPNEFTNSIGLPPSFHPGDLMKTLLLGGTVVGQGALNRFYTLHVIVLPVLTVLFLAAHVWRIRKDGGLSRPGGTPTPAGKGADAADLKPLSPSASPTKTYGLMCVVKGRTPQTGQSADDTVPSWPFLLRTELLVFMLTMLLCVILGYFFDAPLKEVANAAIPENPAKAPWYFLGVQELVAYSAFVGGVVIPTIVVIGLALIPYLDREMEDSGVWFSGARGRRIALLSVVVGAALAVAFVAIPVRFGWLRTWFPEIPQLIILLVNPGSLLTVAYMLWSLAILQRTRSTRLSAIALFTCFLVGFAILTYVGTYLRGPNWDFFWSAKDWPVH